MRKIISFTKKIWALFIKSKNKEPFSRMIGQREKTCLHLLKKGFNSPKIAECLNLQILTIEFYLKNACRHFNCKRIEDLRSNEAVSKALASFELPISKDRDAIVE